MRVKMGREADAFEDVIPVRVLVTPETVVARVEQEISARRDELCEQFVPSGTPGPLPWPTAVS